MHVIIDWRCLFIQGAEGGGALRLAEVWSIQICGPIFAAPSVVPDTASVIIANAMGLVIAVSAAGGSIASVLYTFENKNL